ncbi:MAG: chorismate mutase [Gammaproteobacteria bacterium RIFCSPHIGHO2_12_FULL_41_15]|nr:MAG: chorismate mutase [Gammaproteobacteria bacterium RIFCSPHIGHO2_12_FULL_41_15]
MATIKQLREKIEVIDSAIIKKIAIRQKLSKQIGQLKNKAGKEILDNKREEALMHLYENLSAQYQLQESFIKRIFKIIITHSRRLQR